MATLFFESNKPVGSLAPNRYDKVLAIGAIILLAAALIAIAKGHADWARVPALVWAHLITILIATALTPYMLLRPRGTRQHRTLGKVWVVAMIATAGISLFVKVIHPGHFSVIHLLSVFTLIMAPRVWLTARAHQVAKHRSAVRGLVTGALLVAGFFTFPFGRMLGTWLFG
ncbi:MAG: hypothetical protein V4459_04915 [Pseudomonadota bacterium]